MAQPSPGQRAGARLLGEFTLDGIALDTLRSRQARVVLKRLALSCGETVPADILVDAVWGDRPPAMPDRDVHVLVSRARSLVGPERLVRRDGGYALLLDWWDIEELQTLAREALRRADDGDLAGAATVATAALALVRGPLLVDEQDAEWTESPRAAVDSVVAGVRRVAARAALESGRLGDATLSAQEALQHDPYDEEALRLLMRTHAAAGRPAVALAEFARFSERLADDLGVDPSAETRALHEALLAEDLPTRPTTLAPARLPGRSDELDALDAEYRRLHDQARLILVAGEPGIGKTALLDAWTTGLRIRGATVLGGRATEGGLALQPVLDALAAGAARRVWDVEEEAGGLPGQTVHPDALTMRIFERLDDVVRSLGPSRAVLVVDDGDAVDEMTWAWFAHLVRRRTPALLVVVAVRDPAIATIAADRILTLGPLDREAVTEVVGADRVEHLWSRSHGNPLLLTELARADDEAGGTGVTASLRDAVAARLARAGDAEATLRAAAVLGGPIDLDLLSAVLDQPPVDVLAHLDHGLGQAFLAERAGVLEFRHALVREALEADATPMRRAWLHRRAAELLRSRRDVPALELARHARLGGDLGLAATSLSAAAELAMSRLDLAGAETLLDDALALHDTAALRLHRARIRMARGRVLDADEDAVAAMATDTTGEALELRAWAARNRHDLDAAIRLGTAAAKRATDPGIRGSSLIAVAFGHRGLGDLRRAEAVLEDAVDAPDELGLPAWLGVLRVHQGRPAEALAALEPMLGAEATRGTHGFWVEHTLQMTAHAFGLLGHSADSLRVLDRLATEIERRGTGVRYAGLEATYRSWLLRNLGDPAAEDLAHHALDHAGSAEILAQGHLDVADCRLRIGDVSGAAERLGTADRESGVHRFHNKWRFDQRRILLQARVALAGDDPRTAREAAETVVAAAAGRGDDRYAVLGRLVRATAAARLGDPERDDSVLADLGVLGGVAALEGWWMAADLAAACGPTRSGAAARRTAERLADDVIALSGDRATDVRAAVRARLA